MESEAGLCPALRHRPEQPSPQWVEAVAAFERDDRAAVTVRVPHRLPDSRGNRTGCGVQTAMADFTHRAPAARRYRCAAAVVHTLPHFIAIACTRYRRSSHADTRAGVQGNGAFPDTLPGAHGTVVFLLPLRIGAPSASPPVRSTASARTVTGVVTTISARARTGARRSRQRQRARRASSRSRNGRRCALRAAGQASARSDRRARREGSQRR